MMETIKASVGLKRLRDIKHHNTYKEKSFKLTRRGTTALNKKDWKGEKRFVCLFVCLFLCEPIKQLIPAQGPREINKRNKNIKVI